MASRFLCVIAAVHAKFADSNGPGGGGGPPGGGGGPPRVSVGFLVDKLRTASRDHWDDDRTIGRLIELNRQLQRERVQHMIDARRAWKYAPPRMIVVANRLPLAVKRDENGRLEYSVSAGGMVSALLGVRHVRMIWVGWCPVPDDATPDELRQVRRALLARGCVPIFLQQSEAELYYNGFCNDVLWPLFHYVVSQTTSHEMDDAAEHDEAMWAAYRSVNERFAEVVSSLAREETDLVWVHDYHLMLLPSLLRQRRERLQVGFFLHTPWPSSEVFRTLPMRKEILQGLLGADLVGFHVYDYARHFLHACTRLLGSEVSFSGRRLRWERSRPAELGGGIQRHALKVDAFPIGIDPYRFRRALASDAVKERIKQLHEQFKGCTVLLGVDRVDYIKGIPQKLLAVESLLNEQPELVGKVVLLQIAVPTRTEVPEYQRLRATAHRLVGRINGKFGSTSYMPIHYLDKSIEFEEMVALYHVADVCIVTSLRDGMNLVSYEYVACQEGKEGHQGVLVLSEFAGAAQTLGAGCVRVNPYNIDDLADGLSNAIAMKEEQRDELMQYAIQYVAKFTSQAWAQSFIGSLEEPDSEGLREQSSVASALPVDNVMDSYPTSSRRLILLGVGGPFLPATGATANDYSTLTEDQRNLIARLLRDPANTVLLVSGRSRSRMDELMNSFLDDPAFVGLGEDGRIQLAEDIEELPHMLPKEKPVTAPPPPPESHGIRSSLVGRVRSALGAKPTQQQTQSSQVDEEEAKKPPMPDVPHKWGGSLWALAESGVFARVGSGAWETTLQAAQSDSWLESVEEVFRYFEERTPGSRVERRDRTIRWVYGASDVTLGAQQASNLVEHLEKLLGDAPVERSWESTCVEVRPHGSSCGHGLMQLLAADLSKAEALAAAYAASQVLNGTTNTFEPYEQSGFDFVMGLGNFSTRDEDAFVQLHAAEARANRGHDSAADRWEEGHEQPQQQQFAEDGSPIEEGVFVQQDGDGNVGSVNAAAQEEEYEREAPPLTLGLNASYEGMRAFNVPSGGVFSIILGNRSTHARYFLPSELEATSMLQALANAPQAEEAMRSTRQQLIKHDAAATALARTNAREYYTTGGGVLTLRPPEDSSEVSEADDPFLPRALDRSTLVAISKIIARYWTPAFCLDYDGTLAPLVADPSAARLPPGTRALLKEIADRHPTAIVSGRSMEKLRAWVDVAGLYFAGSHGFEIVGPHGSALNYTFAHELLPSIEKALEALSEALREVDGVLIEDNKFALSVHTRNVSVDDLPKLDALLETALEEQPLLRRSEGKCVIELRPQVHWHKGRAVEWLLKNMCEQMGLPSGAAERNKRVVPIYIGDDTTDEDAFEELRSKGVGIPIVVREEAPRASETKAGYWLKQSEVPDFLALFLHDRVLLQRREGNEEDDEEEEGSEEEVEEEEEAGEPMADPDEGEADRLIKEEEERLRRVPPAPMQAAQAGGGGSSSRPAVSAGTTRISAAARGRALDDDEQA